MPLLSKLFLALALLTTAGLPAACAAPAIQAAATPRTTAAQAELDHLYEGLQASHYDLFARRPQAEYDAMYRRLRSQLGTSAIAPEDLRREFQRFVAYGNVAHAAIEPPMAEWEEYRAAGGSAFPLALRVVGERVVVRDDYSGIETISPGDEVRSIDGIPALEWLGRVRTLVSADNDYLAYTQLETRLPMLVWWHGDRATQYLVETTTPEGLRRRVTVPARSRAEFGTAAAAAPASFDLDGNERVARMIEDGIGYLRPGPFYDNRANSTNPWDPSAFHSFIDRAFTSFIDAGASAVLIDLRNNPGGDNSFSDPMIAWFADKPFRFSPEFDIRVSEAATAANAKRAEAQGTDPEAISVKLAAAYAGKRAGSRVSFPIPLVQPRSDARFTGPVYLLINRHSYSNAVLVAAIAQDYGFATVLGEETADLASTYGAAEKFALPQSGIEVTFPKARILRPNGDPAPRGVVPDVAIETPVVPVQTDVVLDAALQEVLKRGPG
ncbi:S41 family peptidase [Lysobacter korlensis]|uniref:S41 family peptidase n=1 Tax=Lysobacter korlensis TaxID=553636 RepID=A0ABV6RS30_9GAMM